MAASRIVSRGLALSWRGSVRALLFYVHSFTALFFRRLTACLDRLDQDMFCIQGWCKGRIVRRNVNLVVQ
jgi:hypothetical protein